MKKEKKTSNSPNISLFRLNYSVVVVKPVFERLGGVGVWAVNPSSVMNVAA
jgi:hypothetical protein